MKGFIFYYNFKNLTLRLISDKFVLKAVEFCEKKTSSKITQETPPPLIRAVEWLNSYFNTVSAEFPEVVPVSSREKNEMIQGSRKYGNKLFLDMTGYSEKEIVIYKSLLKVPMGSTISYGLLAEISSIPSGGRFAGNCMAKNRFPIIIPCHRVIKADGTWGNFTGGTHIKEFLLEYESRAIKDPGAD